MSLTEIRAVSDQHHETLCLQEIHKHAEQDEQYQSLQNFILKGFPKHRRQLPESCRRYWNVHQQLPYSKKLWRRKNFGEFGESPQFAKFFSPISTCSVWCHVVWHSQPFMRPLNNKRGASPVCMKAAAALQSFNNCMDSPFYTSDNHGS